MQSLLSSVQLFNSSKQDDRPVKDDLNVVSVKWGFGADTTKYNNTEHSIPDDGIIKLKVLDR